MSLTSQLLEDVRVIHKTAFFCPTCNTFHRRSALKIGAYCPVCGRGVSVESSIGVRGTYRGEEYGDFVRVSGDIGHEEAESIARGLLESLEEELRRQHGLLKE